MAQAQEKRETRTEQIEFFPYDPAVVLWDVLRHWYVVAAAVLLVGMGSYVLSEVTYVPRYTTVATLVVSQKDASGNVYQNLTAANSLASVLSEVLNSSILRSAVQESLGMNVSSTIEASVVDETNLLSLRVTDRDPRTAFLVARAIVEQHQIVTKQVMGDTVLDVLQYPLVPVAPSNPKNATGQMKRAMLMAAAASSVLLGMVSYLRDTVRSKQEAEGKLEVRVLEELYHEKKKRTLRARALKKKSSILITDPATSFSFVERVRKLRRRVEVHMPEGGKVLLVASALENEGKSTVAVNLSMALAEKQNRVLLVDGDLRRPACGKILEQPVERGTVTDVIRGRLPLEEAVVPCRKMEQLHLLLDKQRRTVSPDLSGSEGMQRLLEEARKRYDYVVVDTLPMAVSPDTECLAELVDASILVVRQNIATAATLNHALDVLYAAKSKVLGCVLNNMCAPIFSDLSSGHYGYGYGSYRYSGRYGHYSHYGSYSAYESKQRGSDKAGNKNESR